MKGVFVINGTGGSGKDTFVDFVKEVCEEKQLGKVRNFSSVDKVKEVARKVGWDDNQKTDKDRKFLSDLKRLTTEYNDMAFEDMKRAVAEFQENDEEVMMFIHIREPEEIERAVKSFGAEALLVNRGYVIETNESDRRVNEYDYDYYILNTKALDSLRKSAEYFVDDIVSQEKEKRKEEVFVKVVCDYEDFYLTVEVPGGADREEFVESFLKEKLAYYDEILFYALDDDVKREGLEKDYHSIGVTFEDGVKSLVFAEKSEADYYQIQEVIDEFVNKNLSHVADYEDAYVDLTVELAVVKSEFEKDEKAGSVLVKDQVTDESCWIDYEYGDDGMTDWNFNQLGFITNNSKDIDMLRFMDRLQRNSDLVYEAIDKEIDRQLDEKKKGLDEIVSEAEKKKGQNPEEQSHKKEDVER